jgi:WXXGXW repeat (2 copies)
MRRFYALVSLLPALAVVSPAPSYAQLVSIVIAPPVLPVYVQPAIPAPGYIWTPGYWAYGTDDYYWVPGTWVQPPTVGLLWTPGYWGWHDGVYAWNGGYWGPTIGFYGGVNYGFGYGGVGYEGGAWRGGVFSYNRTVNNFGSVNITNVYNKTVIVNNNRVAFNGGTGGITARPNLQEEAAMREQHTPATALQTQHEHTASLSRENFASVNHGAPAVAATSRPGEFSGKGVVGARGAAPAGGLAKGPAAPFGNAASRATGNAPGGGGNPNARANALATGGNSNARANALATGGNPNARANALATGGSAGAGGNSPNREFKSANPGAGAQTGNPKPPGPSSGARAAVAAPHPMAAAPRGPAPPRPGGGGHPGGNNHRPG